MSEPVAGKPTSARRETKPERRARALLRISRSGRRSSRALAAGSLASEFPQVRRAAVQAIAESQNPEFVPNLVEALVHETEFDIISAITAALKTLDSFQAVSELTECLESDDFRQRQNSASALRRGFWEELTAGQRARVCVVQGRWEELANLGRAALAPLKQAVLSGTPYASRCAAEVLGKIATEESCRALLEVVEGDDARESAKRSAAIVLGSLRWHGIDLEALKEKGLITEQEAIVPRSGLPFGPPPEAPSAKPECLPPGTGKTLPPGVAPSGRRLARPGRHVSASVGTGPATHHLQPGDAATDGAPDDLVTMRVDKRLAASLEAISRVLGNPGEDVESRRSAVLKLADMQANEVMPILEFALGDDDWTVRKSVADLMQVRGFQPSDEDNRVRLNIARMDWAAVKQAGAIAVEPLVDALRFQHIADDVIGTLASIRPEGLDALESIAREPRRFEQVVGKVLLELGRKHASGPVEPLVEMLSDEDPAVRMSAVQALDRLQWEPKTDDQRVAFAIAHQNWSALPAYGQAAVVPLMHMIEEGMAIEEVGHTFHTMLQRRPACFLLTQLQKIRRIVQEPECHLSRHMAGELGELAKAELLRRGLFIK